MNQFFDGYTKRDWLISVGLAVAILIICGMLLTNGAPSMQSCDFSAYIAEGIAIAEGTFENQTKINPILHGVNAPEEADENGLVYVWGYPLLLSAVYRAVGFDRVNFSTVIFYKLPSLLAIALAAACLFLFYRRYFTAEISALLTLLFCSNAELLDILNSMYSDIVFLCTSMLTLLLSECFFASVFQKNKKRQASILAVGLGIAFWYTYETRLNGSTVIGAVAMAHVIRLLQNRKQLTRKQLFLHGSPYALFFILKVVSENILLPATPNLSDIGNTDLETIKFQCYFYYRLTKGFINGLFGATSVQIWPLLLAIGIFGGLKEGFRLKHIHFSCLILGTYLVLVFLPYRQGLRYMLNILPLILFYIAWGGVTIGKWLCKKTPGMVRIWKGVACVAGVLAVIIMYTPVVQAGVENIRNDRQVTQTDVYSEDAIQMYRYIQENTPEDARIYFIKGRILYLNTGRLCSDRRAEDYDLKNSDYYLYSAVLSSSEDRDAVLEQVPMELCFENEQFALYKILK